jgi:SAM-dependent methyltransferase
MYRLLVAMVVAIGLLMPMTPAWTMAEDVKEPSANKQEPSANKQEPSANKQFRQPDVIYVPTPDEVVEKMLDMAKVEKGNVVYDLGCGDGRIVVAAAKRGAKATGWDINPDRVKEAEANVKKNKVEQSAKIIQDDIFTLDLSGANVVTLYLLSRLNVKLIPQLEKLKPGSRIVSHDFDMEGVKPDQVVQFAGKDSGSHTIYLWTTPLKKEPLKKE